MTLPLILLSVILNTTAQVMLKKGLNTIGFIGFKKEILLKSLLKIVSSPFIMGGIAFFVVSLALWLVILSRTDLSVAYPMTSLSYVLTALLGYVFLGETLSLSRMGGIVIIMIGVYYVSR
tara:strand:- start:39 stop:398 length:360 start_codon:yes stop_codon:yes gene_type:complete